MDDLNVQIDGRIREKLYSLIEENAVRVKKVNIRYTKNNQKNSKERMDALYASYERLIRSVPKEILRVEKTIRLKFLVPVDEERKIRILSNITREVEVIIQEMIDKFRDLFAHLGHVGDFDKRIDQTRASAKEGIEIQVNKLVDSLNTDLNASKKMTPLELQQIYGIDAETMKQLNLIDPLQGIHSIFENLKVNSVDESVLTNVHEGIIEHVKIGKMIEKEIPPSSMVNERKGWKMRVAKHAMNLKELILSILTLAEQRRYSREQRNPDIIRKSWTRIENSIQENPPEERALIFSKLKSFYQTLEN